MTPRLNIFGFVFFDKKVSLSKFYFIFSVHIRCLFLYCYLNLYNCYLIKIFLNAFSLEHEPHIIVVTQSSPFGAIDINVRSNLLGQSSPGNTPNAGRFTNAEMQNKKLIKNILLQGDRKNLPLKLFSSLKADRNSG